MKPLNGHSAVHSATAAVRHGLAEQSQERCSLYPHALQQTRVVMVCRR